MSALEQYGRYCFLILKADLTNDTYGVIQEKNMGNPVLEDSVEMKPGLKELWDSYVASGGIFSEDLADFHEYVNISFVSDFFRRYHGKESFEINFRINRDGEYQPVHLDILAAEEYTNEHQIVYLYFKGVGNKLKEDYIHFDELLRGLSENYGAIYYVDFDKDIVRPFRMNQEIEEAFGDYFRSLPTYDAAMKGYINTVVSEKDREEMLAVTQYEFLKEQLKDVRAYSHEYRLERYGRELVFRFKIANMDGVGELHKAVIGFANVSQEKRTVNIDYQSGKKILIVEDEEESRKSLTEILSPYYEVIVTENGQEALEVLNRSYKDIAVVMTDLQMPVMDGYELIRQMKRTRQYSNIPVIVSTTTLVLNSDKKEEIQTICLELGASDFVLKPFNHQIVLKRIRSIIRLKESTTILYTLEKDSLTGLYAKDFFFRRVEQYLREHPEESFAMWVTDIEGLKVINEKYGIEAGDEILKIMASGRHQTEGFVLGGRIEGDKLAALVKESALVKLWEAMKKPDLGATFPVPNVVIKSGIYHIRQNSTLRPQGMYDRALLALQKIKSTYGVYCAEYDDELRKVLLTKRQVAENAEDALSEHQFIVYYQPKYDIQKGLTGGAEALIRWIHPELGFMNPGVFIPQFEQNGFIKKLDYYVWEEVCKSLKEWKDKGLRMVPVSVNVSRRDFEDECLAERVIELVDRYGIDHSYFHVEVTESAYSDNPQGIAETIRKFHDNGFIVELDDFGTGYSSMTALSELNLDIMKLDMSLIRNDDPNSDRSVLEFSVQLAKMMKLKTVAEGVETEEQVQRIASLGGDYIQGYFYSKPLPKQEFEQYLIDEQNS